MKTNYLLTFMVIVVAVSTANAQFTDDFESYPLGAYYGGNWSTWSGTDGPQNIIISDTYAYDGTKSGLIGGDQVQDVMLGLGNQTIGTYQLNFQMYIPTGKSAYMSFQGTTTANGGAGNGGAGVFNSKNLLFNNTSSSGGSAGVGGAYNNPNDATPLYTWTYPEDTWFPVTIDFNVDARTWIMTINGTELAQRFFGADNVLGAMNFYSITGNNEAYIDAISFEATNLSINDETSNVFKAHPNPVKDFLYLTSQGVVDILEVYDILGHKVSSYTPGIISPKIDMSSLSSGSYIVKAYIGNQLKAMKIIK